MRVGETSTSLSHFGLELVLDTDYVIAKYELMLCLQVFSQTWPPRRIECSLPPLSLLLFSQIWLAT